MAIAQKSDGSHKGVQNNKAHLEINPQYEYERKDIEAASNGNKRAFAKLYRKHHGQIYGFCSRLLKGRGDVEDAVQQVFLEAWRSLYRFEGRSSFSTWLTKIAIHTCLSQRRKNGRIMVQIQDESQKVEQLTEVVWGSSPMSPDETYLYSTKCKAVMKILGHMTSKKKTVFLMSEFQGMSAPEISDHLGIPDATVRTRLFHARKEFASLSSKNAVYRDLFCEKRMHLKKRGAQSSNENCTST